MRRFYSLERSDDHQEGGDMKLVELSYGRIRAATVTELYDISENAGIQDDERLSHSEDLRERLILMKRKLEGSSNVWRHLFRSVHEETQVKIESLIHLMETVEKSFQTIPTESLSEILRKEGHIQCRSLLEEISTRMRSLTERRSLVVVAGETNGGKSTFLNLLLGEDILPTDILHCTFAVCKIVYSDDYSIKTLDHNDEEEYFPCASREEVKAILKIKLTEPKMAEREFESPIKEITLGLPADILKSGVVLVDTPGIGENEVMDGVTMNFLKSEHVSAYIYIIKSDTAGGVQEDRLLSILNAIKEQYSSDAMKEAFDPRAAMFVCHRWDNIEEQQREKVKLNALRKLEYVWPGFDSSQTYFFSTKDTMKHLPVDPEYVTDSFMLLLKGLKQLFDRACHNAIKHQYIWLKYMLQPASRHLKSVITHCIMSNEELEEYFRSVAEKQNKLMVSSTESSRKLQNELDKMSWELKALVSSNLNFDSTSPRLEIQDCEEIIDMCSKENFFATQANRRVLDEMIVQSLLRRVDEFVHMRKVVNEMESKILMAIRDHLGLFKCQITQIKHDMLHGVTARVSPSPSMASLEVEDTSRELGASTQSMVSSDSNNSSIADFQENIILDPSSLAVTVKSLLLRRKEGKPTTRKTTNSKHEIRQSLLGKIGDKIKGALSRPEPAAYVEERIRKVSKDIRENEEIMDSIIKGYTEWIQQCVTYTVDSIPKFIEVNTKLMDEIREHRAIFQRNKDLLVRVMENLEPCRHHLKGYGLLYMDDINAETLAFNTEHRTSTVSIPKYLVPEPHRSVDSGFHGSISNGLWAKIHGATIQIDNEENIIVIKTYTQELDENLILPEIASLRCLDYTNLAPFLGMTRISAGSKKGKSALSADPEIATVKVSAFIFKGDLLSVHEYSKKRRANMQQFIPEMINSLLRGLNYIHREGLVHMELNLSTVMVERVSGRVKLCQMCKPREATFPADLDVPTKSHVCLSPSVLQGNFYESTDDVYAFGLLLWELLFPDEPPYEEQRLWKLRKFIAECHPANMLQENLDMLKVSDGVRDVLKGTLLVSRGHVCMSIAAIQSSLKDLHTEPAVMNRNIEVEVNDSSDGNASYLAAPEVELTTPTGTETKMKFNFDETIDLPEGFPYTRTDSHHASTKSNTLRKLSSILGESPDKIGTELFVPEQKRRISEPDLRLYASPTDKSQNKPLKFFKKLLKRISPKKSTGEECKQSEEIDNISYSNSRRGTLPLSDDRKSSLLDIECSTPQLRPKRQSEDTEIDYLHDSKPHVKHNSVPDQLLFGLKTVNLGRKESIDVPAVMSEKYRLSLGNKLSRNGASRLNPLSSLKSDLLLSGSMPSLVRINESNDHQKAHFQRRQHPTKFLASSSNPRSQNHKPSNIESRNQRFSIPHEPSTTITQNNHPRLRWGRSLQNISDSSFNETHSTELVMKHSASSANLLDKHVSGYTTRINGVAPFFKQNNGHLRKLSPLAVTSQSDTSVPTLSYNSAETLTEIRSTEISQTIDLSSSASSRGADSGFSTDASGRGAKDLLGSCDDLQTMSIFLDKSFSDRDNLTDEINDSFVHYRIHPELEKTSISHLESSMETSSDTATCSSTDYSLAYRGSSSETTKGLFQENSRNDSEMYADKYAQSQRNEVPCDGNNNSSIPLPPPINFSELSFTCDSYDNYDSD